MPGPFTVIGILILLGVAADAVDAIAYQIHTAEHGIGFLDTVPWRVTWEYLCSPLGCALTIVGVAPWLILLGWARLR